MIKKEDIKKILELQTVITFINLKLAGNVKLAYSKDEIGLMTENIKLKEDVDKYKQELDAIVKSYRYDEIKEVFSNKELIQSNEYIVTLEMQKQLAEKYIGESITIEEAYGKYTN